MCALTDRAKRAAQRAELKRQLEEEAEMEPKEKITQPQKGKRAQPQEGGPRKKQDTKEIRPHEEEDTTPEPADRQSSREPSMPSDMGPSLEDTTPGPADHQSSHEPSMPFDMGPSLEDTAPGPADRQSSREPSVPFDTGPSLEDYNIRTPKRTEILTNLKSLLKADLVSPTFWACCQLSDIETLKTLVDTAKINPSIVLGYDNYISIVPKLCKLPDF